MTTLEQSDLEAARVLAAQHREEGQRLSAEVARLREERDLIAGALREMRATLIAVIDWQGIDHEDEACPEDDTCACPLIARVNAACDASRAALASLGSPQDERNTKKEDAHA
jgi:hypothetical protein